MRIGYPCINVTLPCTSGSAFRLRSFSRERLFATVQANLSCLEHTLRYNEKHTIGFFRITSDLIPFASHPIMDVNWQSHFRKQMCQIGILIKKYNMRISMHPDQFTLVNALDRSIFRNSLRELSYHAQVLELMELPLSAKIQIHVGGVYGNKTLSMRRFTKRWRTLPASVRDRLVIENDEKSYTIHDCLAIHGVTGVPILFDSFHHELNNHGEDIGTLLKKITATWRKQDGLPMIDYSTQKKPGIKGQHAETLNTRHFRTFLQTTRPHDIDIMLEIKDKNRSALKAVKIARRDERFFRSSR